MLQLLLNITYLLLLFVIYKLTLRLYAQCFPHFNMRNRIRFYVRYFLYPEHFQLVENICLTDSKGQQFVLPQVLVGRFGIFILSFCNAHGEIHSNDSITCWFDRKRKWYHPFHNPHISFREVKYLLARYLDVDVKMCQTIAIFHERAEFSRSKQVRNGYLWPMMRYISGQRLGYLYKDEFEATVTKLQKSQLNITSDAKRCIIETGVLTPRPVT